MTRVLSLLGASLPKVLMEAQSDDPAGFWEAQAVTNLNDEILQGQDSEWDDVFAFRQRNYLSNFDRFYLGRALELLEVEFDGSDVIVLKDPRISVLTTFWNRALAEAGYAVTYIAMVRNPMEVADSLRDRNGFPREKSLLLWSGYMLALERDTRGLERIFISYDELMSDWRAARRRIEETAAAPFPRDTAAAANEIDRFLNHKLRHHESRADLLENRDVPEHVKTLYRAFIDAGQGGEIDRAAVDRVYAELCEVEQIVGPLLADWRARTRIIASQLADMTDAEARARSEAEARARSETEAAALRLEEMQQRLEEQAAMLEQERELATAAEARRADLQRQKSGLQSEFEGVQRSLMAKIDRLSSERSLLKREVEAAESRLHKTEQESRGKLQKAESDRAAAQLAAKVSEAKLGERFQELATLTHLLRQQEQHTDTAHEDIDWLIAVQARIANEPKWWGVMPESWRRKRIHRRLSNAGLFDGEAYLQRYPDVAAAGMDPLDHYLQHGIREGRLRSL
jgi:hypothetical protein